MNINIICIGNIKGYLTDAITEYSKRLSKFVNLKIIELKEEKLPKNYSFKDIEIIKEKEGDRIIANLKGYSILLDREGFNLTSDQFADKIKEIMNTSSTLNFIIGGSYGVSDKVKQTVNYSLTFSKLTFPHQLFRVMLLEQIYRSYTIINNITYHK